MGVNSGFGGLGGLAGLAGGGGRGGGGGNNAMNGINIMQNIMKNQSTNKPNSTKAISIFDSNWGMYQKDVELADNILEIMNEYDWPQYIECLTPKISAQIEARGSPLK